MNLEIKCFATLAEFSPPGGRLENIPDGSTVAQIMTLLGVPSEDVRIIFINGVHAAPDAPLCHGDRLGLFPAVGGG